VIDSLSDKNPSDSRILSKEKKAQTFSLKAKTQLNHYIKLTKLSKLSRKQTQHYRPSSNTLKHKIPEDVSQK